MSDRTSELYVLCKADTFGGVITQVPLATKPSVKDLTDEIKKRVENGCPVGKLTVFKVIPFDIKMGVVFKEEN